MFKGLLVHLIPSASHLSGDVMFSSWNSLHGSICGLHLNADMFVRPSCKFASSKEQGKDSILRTELALWKWPHILPEMICRRIAWFANMDRCYRTLLHPNRALFLLLVWWSKHMIKAGPNKKYVVVGYISILSNRGIAIPLCTNNAKDPGLQESQKLHKSQTIHYTSTRFLTSIRMQRN